MYRVSVFMNDHEAVVTKAAYAWDNDIKDHMNAANQDAFTNICGVIVRLKDVRFVLIEDMDIDDERKTDDERKG